MIESKDLVAIAISTVALLVSAISLYVSRLRPGQIHLIAGEHVAISHQVEGSVAFILPVNFANAGSKHLTIDRVALLIQDRGGDEGYLLEPYFYLKLGESGAFTYESLALPITVFGGENVTKQVMFGSSTKRPVEYQMTKTGTYDLTLLGWLHGSSKPRISDFFSLVVAEEDVAVLANHIKEKKTDSIKLRQSKWRNWDAHHCKQAEVEDIESQLMKKSD